MVLWSCWSVLVWLSLMWRGWRGRLEDQGGVQSALPEENSWSGLANAISEFLVAKEKWLVIMEKLYLNARKYLERPQPSWITCCLLSKRLEGAQNISTLWPI